MKDYLLFLVDRDYTDEDGNDVCIDEHLNYLDAWGGTPDCWDTASTLTEAINKAFTYGGPVYIVKDTAGMPVLEIVEGDTLGPSETDN